MKRPKCDECTHWLEGQGQGEHLARNARFRCHCGCDEHLCNTHLDHHGDKGAQLPYWARFNPDGTPVLTFNGPVPAESILFDGGDFVWAHHARRDAAWGSG